MAKFTEFDESRPHMTGGTPESAAWFRTELEALGFTQASLAKWMQRRGDDRLPATIERHIRRMANGEARVSGEMRVILAMLRTGMERRAKRRAASKAA